MNDLNDNFTINTYYSISYYELEKLIESTFGFKKGSVSIPSNEECGNDCSLTFSVTPKKQDEGDLKVSSRIGYFLDEMCYRGLIVPGEYLVDVNW